MFVHALPEVFSARDIADAAGVPVSEVRGLLSRGQIRSVAACLPGAAADPRWEHYVPHAEAVRVVRALRAGDPVAERDPAGLSRLLIAAPPNRSNTVPLIVSTSLHGLVVAAVLIISSIGFINADERTELIEKELPPIRLVFLAQPGPGGGGGGGGLKMRTPPHKAARKGERKVSSPIPARKLPPPIEPKPRPVEPPPTPLEAKILPPVMAPVVPVAADKTDQEGLLKEVPKETPPSQGPGTQGGTGSGKGTGLGEGSGSGIGDGEGGGMGGGPYRPGSGVTPPRLLKEVRAQYTDAGRRDNVTGEVVLEIVVRRNGSVGDVKVLRRLGAGLDEKAIEAVRQWRFTPATMKGTPVDVIVEVSVEFKLR